MKPVGYVSLILVNKPGAYKHTAVQAEYNGVQAYIPKISAQPEPYSRKQLNAHISPGYRLPAVTAFSAQRQEAYHWHKVQCAQRVRTFGAHGAALGNWQLSWKTVYNNV